MLNSSRSAHTSSYYIHRFAPTDFMCQQIHLVLLHAYINRSEQSKQELAAKPLYLQLDAPNVHRGGS